MLFQSQLHEPCMWVLQLVRHAVVGCCLQVGEAFAGDSLTVIAERIKASL